MKFATSAVLLMFLFFIAMPTIVSVIEKNTDTSFCFSMTEEELSHKEVKANFTAGHEYRVVNLSGNTSSLILYENLSKHDKVSKTIFIPPPEQV